MGVHVPENEPHVPPASGAESRSTTPEVPSTPAPVVAGPSVPFTRVSGMKDVTKFGPPLSATDWPVGAATSRTRLKACDAVPGPASERATIFKPLSLSLGVQEYVCDVAVPGAGSTPNTFGKSTVRGGRFVVSPTSTVKFPACAE